jgi:hypothetical protein
MLCAMTQVCYAMRNDPGMLLRRYSGAIQALGRRYDLGMLLRRYPGAGEALLRYY